MKMSSRLFLLLLLVLLLPVCSALADTTREVRQVAAFSAISLGGSQHVILRQGNPQKVEVEGAADDLARLETVVEGKRLRIKMRDTNSSFNWQHSGTVTVYITVPDIDALSVGGSGYIKAVTDVQASALSLSVSGSGRIELPVMQADKLTTAVSGSGSVSVAGICPRHDVQISGSGGVQAAKLRSEACRVRLSGSGGAHVQATRTLEARIAGSGGVYVTGKPQITSSVAGSGRVHSS